MYTIATMCVFVAYYALRGICILLDKEDEERALPVFYYEDHKEVQLMGYWTLRQAHHYFDSIEHDYNKGLGTSGGEEYIVMWKDDGRERLF